MALRYSCPGIIELFTFQSIKKMIDFFFDLCYFFVYWKKLCRFLVSLSFEFLSNISLIFLESSFKKLKNFSFDFFMICLKSLMNMFHSIISIVTESSLFIFKFFFNFHQELLTFWLGHLKVTSKRLWTSVILSLIILCLVELLFNGSLPRFIMRRRWILYQLPAWHALVFG